MNMNTTMSESCRLTGQTGRIHDCGIDFLMFIAVLLVVNSHLDIMYPGRLKFLATGGIFGDALFFFCSGYKLFLKKPGRFDNWYKRRVVRVYPSIVVWDVIAAIFFSLPFSVLNLFDGWRPNGYWFVKCIMFHYIGIYLIQKYMINQLKLAISAVFAGIFVWWLTAYSPEFANAMLSAPKFQWYYMFIFTLAGAILGKHSHIKFRLWMAMLFSFSMFCYYGFLKCVDLFPIITPLRVLVILPIFGVIYGFFLISRSAAVTKLMNTKGGAVLKFCGALCLEVYISHDVLLTGEYNHLFPLNIIVYFFLVFLLAYIVRCVTRCLVQTFNLDKPYDYGAILGRE